MAYQVIKAFTDSNLNSVDETGEKHVYWEGDEYPYKQNAGAQTQLRLAELTNGGFIEEVSEDERTAEC